MGGFGIPPTPSNAVAFAAPPSGGLPGQPPLARALFGGESAGKVHITLCHAGLWLLYNLILPERLDMAVVVRFQAKRRRSAHDVLAFCAFDKSWHMLTTCPSACADPFQACRASPP